MSPSGPYLGQIFFRFEPFADLSTHVMRAKFGRGPMAMSKKRVQTDTHTLRDAAGLYST